MQNIFKIISKRWRSAMPKFFKWILGIAASISGVALAIQTSLLTAGVCIPTWWETLCPYLIGIGAGMAAVAKLTQEH